MGKEVIRVSLDLSVDYLSETLTVGKKVSLLARSLDKSYHHLRANVSIASGKKNLSQ